MMCKKILKKIIKLFFMVLFVAGCLILKFPVLLDAATYYCVYDTYIDAAYPLDNFGGSDRLLLSNTSYPTRALMKFNIPNWVDADNVQEASLIFYSAPWTGGTGGTTEFEVYALTHSWTEGSCIRYNDQKQDDGATWNQYNFDPYPTQNLWNSSGGDYDNSIFTAGTFPQGNDWGPFSIDITDLLKNQLTNLRDYGFLIKHPRDDKAGAWQNFASRESTGYDPPRYPQLAINYIEAPPNIPPNTPVTPSPENAAPKAPLNTVLSWSGGDPDPDNTVVYDVYFGVAGNKQLLSIGQIASSYDPGILQLATTYEWQIIARDNYDAETPGPVWTFSTIESGIASVTPNSGSPFYFKGQRYVSLPQWFLITGDGTHFQFLKSKVSFNDDGIKVLFSVPISPFKIWVAAIIKETALPGPHDITITTGTEVAMSTAVFDVKKFWRGSEQITVRFDSHDALVDLQGLPVHLFKGKDALLLSEVIEKSNAVTAPEKYYYNFIANDNYSMERGIILGGWGTGLPTWSDMQKGYLYLTQSSGLLVGWEPDTVGGKTGGAYNAKFMEGGTIEVREQDIIE